MRGAWFRAEGGKKRVCLQEEGTRRAAADAGKGAGKGDGRVADKAKGAAVDVCAFILGEAMPKARARVEEVVRKTMEVKANRAMGDERRIDARVMGIKEDLRALVELATLAQAALDDLQLPPRQSRGLPDAGVVVSPCSKPALRRCKSTAALLATPHATGTSETPASRRRSHHVGAHLVL